MWSTHSLTRRVNGPRRANGSEHMQAQYDRTSNKDGRFARPMSKPTSKPFRSELKDTE